MSPEREREERFLTEVKGERERLSFDSSESLRNSRGLDTVNSANVALPVFILYTLQHCEATRVAHSVNVVLTHAGSRLRRPSSRYLYARARTHTRNHVQLVCVRLRVRRRGFRNKSACLSAIITIKA